ncbi:alpha/beta fold hydrolase [Nocardioides sp. CBS4Y-1]|uniref:Alpha/beta fold hydrolase n=2 Tax=Nocardioides acrostichi TaxID=2784339 RepID=A0A930UWH3_9ACTN|nr:alpha/beta fold hydrolase [Nocardioides acrostichi]
MLHGGTQRSHDAVDGRSASWRRMSAVQRAITPDLHEHGVATWLLRYRLRGWNGDGTSAQDDARWALDQVREAHGEVPVVLLGHSMGARTAAYVADDRSVQGVVGMAPWWQPDDPVTALAGRHLLAAHGRTDKITSAKMTRAFVRRAEPLAASVSFTDMGRVGHYMMRRIATWNAFAADAVLDVARRA